MLKPISMCSVDFQLFVKKVECQSRYFNRNKRGMRMDFKKTPLCNCERRSIIEFLTAKNKSEAEIHQRLWAVYSEEHVMNARNV